MDPPTFAAFQAAWNAPLRSRDAVENHPWRLVAIAQRLRGKEREQVTAFLCQEIRAGNATLPAIVARGAKLAVVSALEEALPRAHGWEKTEIAQALGRLTRNRRRTVQALIEVIDEGGCKEAAIALGDHRGAQVVRALLRACDDDDDLVRGHAADSLLLATGLWARRYQGGFGRVRTYLSADHPALRRYGRKCFTELRRLQAAGLPYGALGEDLVVAERSAAFDRLFEHHDLDAARRLTPAERVWAEYALLNRFLCGDTRDGLLALAEIGGGPTWNVLRAVRSGLRGEALQIADDVLAALERRKPLG